ncbi:MAG: MFS transporter [Bryobacterales bacterium]|nr:MFS transporter [Bryobacterales bacterium]MBV9400521.1 MFS transporter [Bryobacterales bacterium]
MQPSPSREPAAPSPAQSALASVAPRRALAGFFVSGVLLAFLGAILPAWRHHLSSDYNTVGFYFAGLIVGLLCSVWAAPKLLERKRTGWTLALACGIAGTGFLFLAFVSPPVDASWRVGGMAVIGFAAGLLHTAIFHAISPMYRHDPVATVNIAGILFGLGCLTVTLLISGAFYVYTAPALQAWIAVIPGLFGWMYRRTKFPPDSPPRQPEPNAVLSQLRSPAAVLLALLLYFQLGNEWAIAGWLPLFLTRRLGVSPVTALSMLAMYWLALLVGRVAAQWVLPRVRHSRMLAASVLASVLGCSILSVTDNRFGAIAGILLLGCAFAPIYPLVVEKIGRRFPHFHPGFYNGIFSLAIAGGLLSPCTLGFFASEWGVRIVMGLTLTGSIVVSILLLLIWLEARLNTATA